MNDFTIGVLAKQANVHVETLRYYERRGLIPKPHRTVSNYRVYSSENLRRVMFIKQAQCLGFSLNEIKKLLALRATPRARCADVRTYAAHKIEDIDGKIRSLARMRKTLKKLIAECSGDGPTTRCPILDPLTQNHRPLVKELNQYRKEKCYE
jgi:Hg(II)-responsive transcriptional regulator